MMVNSYTRSAAFYDLIYEFRDIPALNNALVHYLDQHAPAARSVLDVACGTGQQLEALAMYDRMGVDLSPDILAVAAQRVPEVPLLVQDMVELEVPRRFDAVICLASAISYVRTHERLERAVSRMAAHLERGGTLLIEPWFTPEQFWDGHLAVRHAADDTTQLTWMYRQERHGRLSVLPIHYLVGGPEGVEHWVETHEMGLFTDAEYTSALRAAGLEVVPDPGDLAGRNMYVAHKPLA
ncbi:MAG TPA: class I SAM-dependent methyltransferase [Acidimicrobiaceae bacterium]|jgi:SAM-dependent methyltransferase|nr:class I SAM-dependent methyltransferase [Acidimicrobiaceae bacterium]